MTPCAGCSAEVPDGSTLCPACGAPPASEAPTLWDLPASALRERGSHQGRTRFAAGTVLASRYRIVTALGRGGMGEVYRADDLKLNQAVALKFLPLERASDAAALARLRQEVRLARQISHPSVCRVFDLAEIEGQSFLCMEYIDGEDLASLLRRIGRLPVDKALEIARQVAAGLATIHDSGLLHRDLKPGNVMIDGRGRARITDFGLAVLTSEVGAGRQAGTPSYMAPEQHVGHEASQQTDLYAFGLVVFEMLAGHPAWSAEGGPERPVLPASVADGVDARIRTVLLRCLEADPNRRPASALHIVAALTGQDPMALALADGLTLSPEAVAAVSRTGSLRPAMALTLLMVTLAGLGAVIALGGKVQTFRQVPSQHSPDVLTDRAQSLLRELGVKTSSRDRASGFAFDRAYDRYLAVDLANGERRRLLATGRPPLYVFWYRTSPDLLLPAETSVTPDDPPRKTAGESYVELDLEGRLSHLEAVPAGSVPAESPAAPDWSPLLAAAGFDAAQLKAVPPQQPPPVFADSRAAWEGAAPGSPNLRLRIEAAACQGAPVWLDITGPWSKYGEPKPGHLPIGSRLTSGFRLAFEWTVLLTGFLLARRNLRLGRGDLRGAFRLAVFAFSITFLGWLIDPSRTLTPVEARFNGQLGTALLQGLIFWTFYLGFEPSVRRLWPERIIAWNRMLAGRFRDPLVGRDVLIGCLLGLGKVLFRYARELPKTWAVERPSLGVGTLSGNLQNPVQHVPQIFFDGLFLSLEFMLFFLVLRILLRQEKLTNAVLWALLTLGLALPGPYMGLNLVWSGLGALLLVIAYGRFGPLAGSALWVTYMLCILYPLTFDTTLWYAGGGLFAVLVIVALALYGFAASVAGQPWFARSGVLDD